MLGCRFSFEVYAIRATRATKCSLKTAEFLLDADGNALTEV